MATNSNAAMLRMFDLPFDKLTSDYSFPEKKLLQSGSFGKVYLIQRQTSGQSYALKEIFKGTLDNPRQSVSIKRERIALKSFNSHYIIRLWDTYQNENYVYFLMDYAQNGDLRRHINDAKSPLQIPCVRFIASELIMGLQYLRSMRFVHRDIKLRNILVDCNFHVKLSDFGTAKIIGENQGTSLVQSVIEKNSRSGTKCFLAPEVFFRQNVSFGTDYWCLGLVIFKLYTLVTLGWDYRTETYHEYSNKIDEGEWIFPFLNPDRKINDLVYRLTRRLPEDRIGTLNFQDLKNHPFFTDVEWDNLRSTESPGIQTIDDWVYDQVVGNSVRLLDLQIPPPQTQPFSAPIQLHKSAITTAPTPARHRSETYPIAPATNPVALPLTLATQTPPWTTPSAPSGSFFNTSPLPPYARPRTSSLAPTGSSAHTPLPWLPPPARDRASTLESGYNTVSTAGARRRSSAGVSSGYQESLRHLTQSLEDMWKQVKSPPPSSTDK